MADKVERIGRRDFLAGTTGMMAAAAAPSAVAPPPRTPEAEKTPESGKLVVSEPMLQNPAETSMGVAWAVSDLANGYVDVSESPDMSDARRVKCGGFRFTGVNDKVMQVRLTGLKPATRYYYRIFTDRIRCRGGYSMKRAGTETDGKVRSFVTLGAAGGSKFCVINDTHKRIGPLNMVLDKVAEIDPLCVVWNGDACTVEENMDSVVSTFLSPGADRKDYASSIPYILCPGNHEQRGLGARRLEDVFMFRQPEERRPRDWDLGRNFAVRLGDVALFGLDTGDDISDTSDIAAGLLSNAAYREAQADWLRDTLRRDDIASAPFLVGMCHIPLFSAGLMKADPVRFAWQLQCGNLWGPILDEGGCQLMVSGHTHRFGYREKVPGRKWGQLTGGGPELCCRFDRVLKKQVKDEGRFPTVIEGNVEDNRLVVTVHDAYRGKIARRFSLAARRIADAALAIALAGLSHAAFAGNAASGVFEQKKFLRDIGVTLSSSGVWSFEKGKSFSWKTLKPAPSHFVATPTNYSFTAGGRTTVRRLDMEIGNLAQVFEMKEMQGVVDRVERPPAEPVFRSDGMEIPSSLKVFFRNGDRLDITLRR